MADVIRYGTDTSGRPILMTRYMKSALESVLADQIVAPFADDIVIVQGAFMSRVPGGGADASAGYHDLAGCIDFRTWNLSNAQIDAFVRAWRKRGGAAWRRDQSPSHGGMDPHCHVTLGGDVPKTDGAQDSWNQYVSGSNGLTGSSHGPDYEWRPSPLVLKYTPSEEDDMQLTDKVRGDKTVRDALVAALNVEQRLSRFRANVREAFAELEAEVSDDATKAQVRRMSQRLSAKLDEAESTQ